MPAISREDCGESCYSWDRSRIPLPNIKERRSLHRFLAVGIWPLAHSLEYEQLWPGFEESSLLLQQNKRLNLIESFVTNCSTLR